MNTVWKPIPEFPDYVMNIEGVIKRLATSVTRTDGVVLHYAERVIRHQDHPSGIAVHLHTGGAVKWVGVAPILLELFGSEPKPVDGGPWRAAHKNGNKWDIELKNLKWATFSEIRRARPRR